MPRNIFNRIIRGTRNRQNAHSNNQTSNAAQPNTVVVDLTNVTQETSLLMQQIINHMASQDAKIAELQGQVEEQQRQIEEQQRQIANKDAIIESQADEIRILDETVESLENRNRQNAQNNPGPSRVPEADDASIISSTTDSQYDSVTASNPGLIRRDSSISNMFIRNNTTIRKQKLSNRVNL